MARRDCLICLGYYIMVFHCLNFFNPPAYLSAVTYIKILLHVTLSNKSHPSLITSITLWWYLIIIWWSLTEDAYSSGHLVLSHLGLVFVLMLRSFSHELACHVFGFWISNIPLYFYFAFIVCWSLIMLWWSFIMLWSSFIMIWWSFIMSCWSFIICWSFVMTWSPVGTMESRMYPPYPHRFVNWCEFNVTINDISVIYVTEMCRRIEEKVGPTVGLQTP